MKSIIRNLAFVCAAILALASCHQEKTRKALLPNITGTAGEVIVVIGQNEWEGAVGTVLRDSLSREFPQLPQREPLFNLVNVPQAAFTSMFQVHRNIIVVNISKDVTEPGVLYRNDVWAAPQTVIRVNAPDSETAVQLIKENSSTIIGMLEEAERARMIRNAKKYEERSIAPVVTEMVGGSPHFPSGYKLKKRTDDFIWVSYDPEYVSQGILIYKYPVVEGEDMMSPENLLEANSRMLMENVPGMFENTYMVMSSYAPPTVKYMKYHGLQFAEIRGLWEVHNDYMGGPFVTHVFYSPDGKNMIGIEGFVYAPKFDKRQYLRQVESIIYSFEWAKTDEEVNKE
ncbi:MAG: DUF4837 family protein [Bacteroidales bacterium]|nr:DUF4837 family protein [Bacteroidales bacterium]